jgi:sirohydrochlorin ferrochelatase
MTALIVFAHGSTVEEANEGVRAVTATVAERGGYSMVETAFLDCAEPTLGQAVDGLSGRGATRIVVVPFFLTLGVHLKRDLPGIVERLRSIHPSVTIEVTSPLEGHPALVDMVLGRAEEALHGGSRSAGETR